jgi:uncharacterized protein
VLSPTILLLSLFASITNIEPVHYKLALAAESLTSAQVTYDPSYYIIGYPNGDVPADKGVCADVVIRAYRKLGIDLQEKLHLDMRKNFSAYPNNWGLRNCDKNIDHRRVPNLIKFFERQGQILTISKKEADYMPGDIVCWLIQGKLPHIGIVSSKKVARTNRYMIVHNVGDGQVLEDCLFRYVINGHYRYG